MGILQARILKWVAIPSSRGSSRPRDRTQVSCGSCIAGRIFAAEPPGKPVVAIISMKKGSSPRKGGSPAEKGVLPQQGAWISDPQIHTAAHPLTSCGHRPQLLTGPRLPVFQGVLSHLGGPESTTTTPFPPPHPRYSCPTALASEPTAVKAEGCQPKTSQKGDPASWMQQVTSQLLQEGQLGGAFRGTGNLAPCRRPSEPSRPPGCPTQGRPGLPGACGYR